MNPAYRLQMEKQLGPEEAGLYFAVLEQNYMRGIRLNPRKKDAPKPDGLLEPVPWAGGNAYYLSQSSTAGAHILHEAGAWYLQEPSAMASVAVLNPQPGERILDLCAAPGGKSTQIAERIGSCGLLVCNEPVPSRAKILSRNIERMGIPNALVVNALPEQLAPLWEAALDAVLVDAPCSGEGMFRRHPETQQEWQEASPAGCAERQSRILAQAQRMVRPGGRMVYSTCTFNHRENEDVIANFLQTHPQWTAVAFSLPEAGNAPQGMLHLYPHRVKGEGHFVALLQNTSKGAAADAFAPAARQLVSPTKEMLALWRDFSMGKNLPMPNAVLGGILLSSPELPPLSGVRVLRAGLHLGMQKGKVWAPDHALALALYAPYPFPVLPLNEGEAARYQSGETLPVPEALKGWVLPCFSGIALGFGKASDGMLKNHYPKGLRR